MRYIVILFILGCGACSNSLFAQRDSIQELPEVILSDVKLKKHSTGIHSTQLDDSLFFRSPSTLTAILQDNSLLYFRENGLGGVSSVSFRGTSAQQTAVIWNGININSQLTGQTDFNTVSVKNYDGLTIRAGGGSIPYGSGAIGGSIHLNNDMRFTRNFTNRIHLGYGSFDTRTANANTTFSTERFYLNAGVDYNASENDFDYLENSGFNDNGAFENVTLNVNTGIKLSRKRKKPTQYLKIYHNSFLGNRDFAGTLIGPSNDAYEDRNSRSLVNYEIDGTRLSSNLRVAHIFEQFRYFDNTDNRDIYESGKVSRYLSNYDGEYKIDNTKSLKAIVGYELIRGEGSSIEEQSRSIISGVLLWNHKLTSDIQYNLQLRQEYTEDYSNPFLYGIGAEYALSKKSTLSANASRNYRIPTFNDLYWQGLGAVGNNSLSPETSLQGEVGYDFKDKSLRFGVQTYYIKTADLIKWQPNSSGVWSPVNINETIHYGVTLSAGYSVTLGEHTIETASSYGYTVAENAETGFQLIYVPKHKIITGVNHDYKWLSTYVNATYNGGVFITSDNSNELDDFIVANAGLSIQLVKNKNNKVAFSSGMRNILNTNYQTVAFRPNPGRNFFIQTTYNF